MDVEDAVDPWVALRQLGDHEVNNGERWSWILLLDCSLNIYGLYIKQSGSSLFHCSLSTTIQRHQGNFNLFSHIQLKPAQISPTQPNISSPNLIHNTNIIMDATTQNKRTSTDNRRPVRLLAIHLSLTSPI
jgi:hypothetical protein